MDPIQIIGYTATALVGLAFIPQTIKVWKTKSVGDISLPTFLMLCAGTVLWLIYAYANQDFPLLLVNTLLILNQGSILLCKILYDQK